MDSRFDADTASVTESFTGYQPVSRETTIEECIEQEHDCHSRYFEPDCDECLKEREQCANEN